MRKQLLAGIATSIVTVSLSVPAMAFSFKDLLLNGNSEISIPKRQMAGGCLYSDVKMTPKKNGNGGYTISYRAVIAVSPNLGPDEVSGGTVDFLTLKGTYNYNNSGKLPGDQSVQESVTRQVRNVAKGFRMVGRQDLQCVYQDDISDYLPGGQLAGGLS